MIMPSSVPFLVVFCIVGFGMVMVFCTVCCKICFMRQAQVERHAQMCREQERHAQMCREQENLRSIYFIPFPQSISRHDSEDLHATAIHSERPPSYNELGFKSDDLPPPYTYSTFAENVAPSYSGS